MKKVLLIVLLVLVSFAIVYGNLWQRDRSGNYGVITRVEVDDSTFTNVITVLDTISVGIITIRDTADVNVVLVGDTIEINVINNLDDTAFVNVISASADTLSVSVKDTYAGMSFLQGVSEGLVSGYVSRSMLGLSDSIVATLDDVSEIDIQTLLLPGGSGDSARIIEVVSGSDTDSIGNAGALTVLIDGLDSLWNEQADTVTLEGTVPVNTTKTWLRINDFHVLTQGTYGGTAVGDLLIRDTSGTEEYDKISAGGNRSLQCLFTVPNNKTAYITGWFPGVTAQVTGDNTYHIVLRATCTILEKTLLPGVFLFQDQAVSVNNTTFRLFNPPLKIPEHADIKVSAHRIDGNKEAEVSASISMYLKDD